MFSHRPPGRSTRLISGGRLAEIGARDVDEPRRHHRVERSRRDRRAERVGEHEREPVAHDERAREAARDDDDLVGVRVDRKLRQLDRFAGEQLVSDQERQRVDVERERLRRTAGLVDVDRQPPRAGAEDGDALEAGRHQRLEEVERQRALALAPRPSRETGARNIRGSPAAPARAGSESPTRPSRPRPRRAARTTTSTASSCCANPFAMRTQPLPRARQEIGRVRLALQLLHARSRCSTCSRRAAATTSSATARDRRPGRESGRGADSSPPHRSQRQPPLVSLSASAPAQRGAAEDVREQRPSFLRHRRPAVEPPRATKVAPRDAAPAPLCSRALLRAMT